MNKTLTERSKSLHVHVGLSKWFWVEAVNTLAYLINWGPSVPLKHIIRFMELKRC